MCSNLSPSISIYHLNVRRPTISLLWGVSVEDFLLPYHDSVQGLHMTANHAIPSSPRLEVASMRRKIRTKKQDRRRTKLGLPDLEHVKSAVLVSLRSPESQRSYRRSIEDFVYWYCSEPRLSFNKTVVTRYRIHLEDRLLAPGTINVRLAAVRRLAYEAADAGLLSPDLAAGIRRVKGAKKLGMRLGNWLTAMMPAPSGSFLTCTP